MPAPVRTVADFILPGSNMFIGGGDSQVHALSNGQFDIAWLKDYSPDDCDVTIEHFNADGSDPSGGVTIYPTGPVDNWEVSPSLASNGKQQAIAFMDYPAGSSKAEIHLSFYDQGDFTNTHGFNNGTIVVADAASPQYSPEVTALANGSFAVAFIDDATKSVMSRVWDPALNHFTGPAVKVSTDPTTQLFGDLGMTALSNGFFAVSWTDDRDINHFRTFDKFGFPVSSDKVVANNSANGGTHIVELANHTLAVVIDGPKVLLRTFNYDGTNGSPLFEVSAHGTNSTVTALQDGRLMVAWTDGAAIRGQIMTSNGMKDGAVFDIANSTHHAEAASLSTLADGRVVVSHTDVDNETVHATVFDPREAGVLLHGTDQADQFIGTAFADTFNMGDGDDTVSGGAGNDVIDGEIGADHMDGGKGNDTLFVDNVGDKVIEAKGGGTDTVYASVSYTLNAGAEVETLRATNSSSSETDIHLTGNEFGQTLKGTSDANVMDGAGGADTMQGYGGDDRYYVDNGKDKVVEVSGASGGKDVVYASASWTLGAGQGVEFLQVNNKAGITLTGNEFAQAIVGDKGADHLNGAGGNDKLFGGLGPDKLSGGTGDDTFYFTTALGTKNVDHVTDFASASGNDDTFRLANAVFTTLHAGALDASEFYVGKAAHDSDDRIIYNHSSGALYYDHDGKGGDAAIQFAQIDNHATLTASDFFVV